MAILVQDSFNRANSTTVLGAPAIGPSPTVLDGVWGISSNEAYSSTPGTNGGIVVWECSTANVDITLKRTIPTAGNSGGIILGAVTSLNAWYAFFNRDTSAGITDSNLGRFSGTTSLNQVIKGKNGTFIASTSVLRLIHFNGWIEMWSDTTLVARGFVPEPVIGTRHGIRAPASTQRFDDLTISDAPDITLPTKTGEVREPVFGTSSLSAKDSFLYRGRDTKNQDITGVS